MDNNLTGWRTSASKASSLVKQLANLRTELASEFAVRDILVIGMGGSALGAQMLTDLYEQELRNLKVRIRILHTTEPSAVIRMLANFDASQGLVLVSSKSGISADTLCLQKIVFAQIVEALGSEQAAAAHFISLSDEGSLLTSLARSQQWRGVILTPRNVGGRFSVLTAFGLAPLALAGVDVSELIVFAQAMQLRCNSSEASCPATQLTEALLTHLRSGRNKLLIACDRSSESFGRWLEQLIAESLGKEGQGLVPIVMSPERVRRLMDTRAVDVQSIAVPPFTPANLGSEVVRWMYAIERLGEILGLNPFNQPDVELSKKESLRILSDPTLRNNVGAALDPRVGSFLMLPLFIQPSSYISILAWAPETEDYRTDIEGLASALEEAYGRPVCIAFGPHYLHAAGQLYKGGPAQGIFILAQENGQFDLAIPGEYYTLRQLYQTQREGDVNALLSLGRPVISL